MGGAGGSARVFLNTVIEWGTLRALPPREATMQLNDRQKAHVANIRARYDGNVIANRRHRQDVFELLEVLDALTGREVLEETLAEEAAEESAAGADEEPGETPDDHPGVLGEIALNPDGTPPNTPGSAE